MSPDLKKEALFVRLQLRHCDFPRMKASLDIETEIMSQIPQIVKRLCLNLQLPFCQVILPYESVGGRP
jgi:hypothetical protein